MNFEKIYYFYCFKVWDVRVGKLLLDLPGHGDEVFAIDWSPDGERVVSGGKDTVLKIWRR